MFAFLLIGSVGFIMLVLTWFIGELFDLGHDLTGFFGGDHAGDVSDGPDGGPSPFSSRVIFTFMTAFGGGGAVASMYGLPVIACVGVGTLLGVVMGGATYAFARILYGQQASSGFDVGSLVGQPARVTVAIAPGKSGQVVVSAGGGSSTLLARTRDGVALPEGEMVRVVQVQGDVLYVEK